MSFTGIIEKTLFHKNRLTVVTPASGAGDRKAVWIRVFLPAPYWCNKMESHQENCVITQFFCVYEPKSSS